MPAKTAPKPKAAAPKPKAAPAPKPKAAPAPKPKASAPKAAPAPKAKAAAPKAQRAAGNAHGVYVSKWGAASAQEAAAVFASAGKVESVAVRRHRYALVFFDGPAAVKKAIDLFNNKEVLGATVAVAPARTSPKPDAHANSSCVFVSPVFRAAATKAQIMSLFAGYKVLRMRTYRNNYAYAFLESPAAAQKFQKEKNGSEFLGHKLQVKMSTKSLEKVKERQAHAKLLMDAHRHKKAHTAH